MASPIYEWVAKLALDDSAMEEGLKGAGSKLKSFSVGAAKLIGTGIAAGAAAVGALTKQAVEAYSEYEQLAGGVKKLFGEDVQKTVMENAQNAYKTAGMSANEYLDTVTSFSASLISGLGGDTEQAAELSDMAIRDMSDNANTFGTDIESLKNAYAGFAKGNFTMLDNLKLGYGGTAEEMARLVNESGILGDGITATAEDMKNMPFDLMIRAINETQKRMGIAGTTSAEAMSTIEGSVNAAKSAWANLVTGLADSNADMESLVNNFLETIIGVNGEGGVLNNILPRVEQILNGISTLISTVAPTLIPLAINIIVENLPMLIEAGTQLLVALITGLAAALPQLVAALPQIITAIVTSLKAAWPDIKQAGIDLFNMIAEGIKSMLSSAKSWGTDLIQNFINGIKEKAKALVEEVKGIAQSIADFLHFSVPDKGPLSDLDESPKDMMNMYASGIRKNAHLVTDELDDALSYDASIGYSNASSALGNVVNIAPVINIDGAKYDDERSLAEAIAFEIKNMIDSEEAATA